MLSIFNEIDYCFDMCRITIGAYIEIREVTIKTERSCLCSSNFISVHGIRFWNKFLRV